MGCLLMASYAALLCALGMLTGCTCGCAPTVCWAKGFVAFLPVLRSPACSGSASYCGFSSPIWFITFTMGSPLRGRGLFVLDRNAGLPSFSLSLLGCFFVLSLPFRIWSPYGSGVGRSYARPMVVVVLRPFSFWMGFDPLSQASLSALSLLEVVLAEDECLRLSLALSSVLPCPLLWFHVCLHNSCSRSTVVLGALPLILPDGV